MFIHIYIHTYIYIFLTYTDTHSYLVLVAKQFGTLSGSSSCHHERCSTCRTHACAASFRTRGWASGGERKWIKPPKLKWRAPTPYNDRSGTPNSGSSVDWLWIIQAFGDFPVLKLMTLGDKSLVFDLIMDGSILHDGWVSFRSFMIYGSKTLISNLFIFFLQTPWMSRCLNTLPKLPQDDGFQ